MRGSVYTHFGSSVFLFVQRHLVCEHFYIIFAFISFNPQPGHPILTTSGPLTCLPLALSPTPAPTPSVTACRFPHSFIENRKKPFAKALPPMEPENGGKCQTNPKVIWVVVVIIQFSLFLLFSPFSYFCSLFCPAILLMLSHLPQAYPHRH